MNGEKKIVEIVYKNAVTVIILLLLSISSNP